MIEIILILAITILFTSIVNAEDLGNYSSNPYDSDSTSNPYGAGSPSDSDSINNPYGTYGSPYSNESANNPYATDAPKLYDQEGNYRGKLSNNPYDPDSISNPYGKYGSPFSPDSVSNPYGAAAHILRIVQIIPMEVVGTLKANKIHPAKARKVI